MRARVRVRVRARVRVRVRPQQARRWLLTPSYLASSCSSDHSSSSAASP